jgi:hypothetical protein
VAWCSKIWGTRFESFDGEFLLFSQPALDATEGVYVCYFDCIIEQSRNHKTFL